MTRRKRVRFNRDAYITKYTTLLVMFMTFGWFFLAINVDAWYPVPRPVQVLAWVAGLVPLLAALLLGHLVSIAEEESKDPSEAKEMPRVFGVKQMVMAEYMMLFTLVGVALLLGFVPRYFKPESDLRKLKGPVTGFSEGGPGRGIRIHQNGEESTFRVQNGVTDQLGLIEVGDEIEAMLDGCYAMELHRNGRVLFTYDEYQQYARRIARRCSIMFALAAVGFAVWSRRHAKKKGLFMRSVDDGNG